MEIQTAQKHQALSIARLIMQAMNYDCCRYFTGPDHTLDDFERVMTNMVLAENSQYSYLNTLVAIDADGGLCGACVSYDGARLHELRRPFFDACKEHFGRDVSGIGDETQAGELYLDSLAVYESYRGKGVATRLPSPPLACWLTRATRRPRNSTCVWASSMSATALGEAMR